MSSKNFSIVPIDAEEFPIIGEFIYKYFQDMPLFEAFGIEETWKPSTSSIPEETYVLKAIRPDGTIAGIALNDVKLDLHVDDNTPEPMIKFAEFMKFVEEDSKIESLPEKTLELRVLSVRPDCRGEGIAKSLAEESVKLAKSLGYEMIRMCCANEFTTKIAKSMGWQEFYSLEYKDYGKLSGTGFALKPTPPHNTLSYYIERL